jgi:hypothetical protein
MGILDESDILVPLVKGQLKPTEPIIHLIKGTLVYVKPNDDLSLLNEQLLKGYVALVNVNNELQIISKIDLLQYLGDMKELNS